MKENFINITSAEQSSFKPEKVNKFKAEKPNYLDARSEEAEKEFKKFIEDFKFLGVKNIEAEDIFSSEEGFNTVSELRPERLNLVAEKLNISVEQLAELSPDIFADKVLGIDNFFEYNGKIFGADIASGKSSGIINKRNKMLKMREVYEKIGINNALSVRNNKEIDENLAIIFFSLIEKISSNANKFYMEFRINKKEDFNDVYFSY